MPHSSISESHSSTTGTDSDDSSTPQVPALIDTAIRNIWNENLGEHSLRKLTKATVNRLVEYFELKDDMDESENFINAVQCDADEYQDSFGCQQKSALRQALMKYKECIKDEIRSFAEKERRDDSDSSMAESDEDSKMSTQEDGVEPEQENESEELDYDSDFI